MLNQFYPFLVPGHNIDRKKCLQNFVKIFYRLSVIFDIKTDMGTLVLIFGILGSLNF